MPAKPPIINQSAIDKLIAIGMQIRIHRKALRITAVSAAASAGMSRVTLHRIERGERSVTIGAYLNAMQALGLDFRVHDQASSIAMLNDTRAGWIPVRIRLQDYPELKRLAWHVQGADELTPVEALGIYERNWRHLDTALLTSKEQDLIDGLRQVLARDAEHV